MSPDSALADLIEISSQVEGAVLLGTDGTVVASTFEDEARGADLAAAARRLFEAAEEGEREGPGARPLTQLEASTLDGSIFVVRGGERLIAAVTPPDPTVGLVFYDLKTCLRQSAAAPPEPASKPTKVSRRLKAAEAPDEPATETMEQPAQSAAEAAESPKKPRRARKRPDAAP